jgi:hypothetical protein
MKANPFFCKKKKNYAPLLPGKKEAQSVGLLL